MDSFVVGIIVIAAVLFSIKSFIKTYKGEGSCSCKDGCSSCSIKQTCSSDSPAADKKYPGSF